MSIEAVIWILENAPAEVDAVDLRILLALGLRADREGANAWPGNEEIARRTGGRSVRTVRRRLDALRHQGWFTRTRRYQGGQHWGWNYALSLRPRSYSDMASNPWPQLSRPRPYSDAPHIEATDVFGPDLAKSTSPSIKPIPPNPQGRRPSAEPSMAAQLTAVSVPRVQREERPGFPDIADYQDDIPGYAIAQARWCLAHSTDPGEVERSTAILARHGDAA